MTKLDEEENIEALHHKMVVMSCPLVNYSPYELIDALNMETNSTGMLFSSFDQEDEVCFSPVHPFEILFVSLFN